MKKIILLIFALIMIGFLIKLGFWQIARGNYKESLRKQSEYAQTQAPITLQEIKLTDSKNLSFRKIVLFGKYDNTHNFLLDNIVFKGIPGYYVITPFQPTGSSLWILINRGWVTRGNNYQDVPPIPSIFGNQTIHGDIVLPSKGNLVLKKDGISTAWPAKIQNLNINQISQSLQKPIQPFIVRLSANNTGGFVREWNAQTISGRKNYAYAFQWFALAATLAIICFLILMRHRKA